MNAVAPVEGLRRRAVRGTVAAFSSQAVSFLLNLAVAILLARLLSPEDFGLFEIAVAITSFLEFAKSGGMVVPVIQSETLTADQLDTLFWYNAGVGSVVTVVLCAIAPLVGRLYADARLVPVISTLALIFLFGGLSAQHVALLRRQMRFTALAVCEATSLALASAIAIFAAQHGAKYWSLVYFSLAREALQTVLVVMATGWIPRWPARWAAVGPLVRFGGVMMVFDVFGYLNFKLDNLIVGWFLGPVALGFYAKAYQLVLTPPSQINLPLANVVHSTLSRLQRDPERYRSYLSRALLFAMSLTMPLTTFVYANADVIVEQLLGRQWLPSVPIFKALVPAALSLTISTCSAWIFLSLGRARRQLPWSMLTTTMTICAFLVGVRWGAAGVAIGFSISRVLLLVPTLIYTCHGTSIEWTSILRSAARPAFASAVALAISLTLAMPSSDLWSLPAHAALFGAAYAVCWMALPGGRLLIRENLVLARSLYGNA